MLQWNPSIATTLGEHNFGRYIGWPLLRGCFAHKFGTWVPGRYTEVAGVAGVPLYHCTDLDV